jgi:hypothetical protein
MSELIFLTTKVGRSHMNLRAKGRAAPLSQRAMAKLLNVSTDNVSLYLKNMFDDDELRHAATFEKSAVFQTKGALQEKRKFALYNTASELITTRTNPDDPYFDHMHWQDAQVLKQDILITKRHLSDDEIGTLNRLRLIFIETVEPCTERHEAIPMSLPRQNVDRIIGRNDFPVPAHTSKASNAQNGACHHRAISRL